MPLGCSSFPDQILSPALHDEDQRVRGCFYLPLLHHTRRNASRTSVLMEELPVADRYVDRNDGQD